MLKKSIVCLSVGAVMGVSSVAHAFLIDDFSDDQNVNLLGLVANGPYADWDSNVVAGSMVGGTRKLWLGSETLDQGTGVSSDIATGNWALSADSGVSASHVVYWDGGNSVPTGQNVTGAPNYLPTRPATPNLQNSPGFAQEDLTDSGGSNAFFFDVVSKDMNDWAFTITVYEGASSVAFTGNTGTTALMNQTFAIPFAWFSGATAADFDMVTAITLEIDGTISHDATIDRLYTGRIPEPTTLAILSIGLAGMGATVRRRSRKLDHSI